ncbi:MAG TPA: hemerythrin domain-containing protein [Coxiellaceae bacterium]|nr:hemerythrin domain-containing protein [Coxiellaceae bacterium]
MNAIQLLIDEHNKARAALADISKDTHSYEEKKKLFDELCYILIRHETMEEQVWYPYLKNNENVSDEVKQLISEEQHAVKAIEEFKYISEEAEWESKFAQFKEAAEAHASEEEQKLFPQVAKIISESELEEIGRQMVDFERNYHA